MKHLTIAIVLMTILSGCHSWKKENIQTQEGFTQPISVLEHDLKKENIESSNLQPYKNESLGISFQYPKALGKAFENKDSSNSNELFALKFVDEKGNPAELELFGSGDETLRTCEDILSKGFNDGDRRPSDCETLELDGHSVIILSYIQGGRSNGYTTASKQAQFQTKKGVWVFSALNQNLYDDLLEIVKTLNYLQ